jgi:hypothetical protein
MNEPCWAFHASSIPESSERIVDSRGWLWQRAGTRLWAYAPGDQVEMVKHEGWLLREHGPVRCPVELDFGLPLTDRRAS